MYDDGKEKQTASEEYCRAEMGAKMVKIILCDDNQVFLENLRREIRTILKRNNVDSEIYVFNSLESIRPDLIPQANIFFLDIDFSERQYTGIDIAKKIRSVNERAVIIFVTNYIQYAPEGYEVQAFRYLLKSSIATKLDRCLQQALDKLSVDNETMIITVSGETIILPLKDILYIESQAHNVVINVQPTIGELISQTKTTIQTGPFGTVLHASEFVDYGIPVISVREIREGFIRLTDETPCVTDETFSRLGKYALSANDIVFAQRICTLGYRN